MDISEKIDELEKEKSELDFEIKKLKKVQKIYPDIKTNVNRWSQERLSSKEVNSIVDEVEISHNCGCCDDSPLEVWPYKVVEGLRIFSNPSRFTVADKNAYGCGNIPYDCWEEKLKKENISEVVIKKVEKYLEENSPDDD